MRLPNGQIATQKFTVEPTAEITRIAEIAKAAFRSFGWEDTHQEGIHAIRRSAARGLFEELVLLGYDGALRIVQAMLHHASSAMTELYLGLSVDRKKRDDLLKGRFMYPSLHSDNVIPMDRASHG